MRRSAFARGVAVSLIAALQAWLVPVSAGPTPAVLSGTVVAGDPVGPLAGAKVYAADPTTGRVFASTPTGADGAFTLAELPPSSYEVGVESDGGLFLAASPLALAAGQSASVHLALTRGTAPDPGEDDDDTPAGAVDTGSHSSIWSNPLTAALLVLGGAAVIGVLVETATDDNDPASPSLP